jgi:dipeptidyl aminopeptidase/acylaminoacyl peptidase
VGSGARDRRTRRAVICARISPAINPAVRVELRQDINTPPALYAVDTRTGQARLVLDLNPDLRTKFDLGRVEMVQWKDSAGRVRNGRLYYPVHYVVGHRYPLVLQTHGMAPSDEFSLTGKGGSGRPGLGPGIGIYAAQPLANLDIFVLQVEDKHIEGVTNTTREPAVQLDTMESAVRMLSDRGLIDPKRVGMGGFSRGAWWVEYAIVHAPHIFAAAISADGFDAGYVRALVQWAPVFKDLVGGMPYGEGLRTFLNNAPPFNADKIVTPLQLQTHDEGLPGVMEQWEMFAQLRLLKRPVELYIIPDIEHGTHSLQNPHQILGVQERVVDWWDFWLNSHEDPDPAKHEQYKGWETLRDQRDSMLETDVTAQ